jgi:hypothetical protein
MRCEASGLALQNVGGHGALKNHASIHFGRFNHGLFEGYTVDEVVGNLVSWLRILLFPAGY